MITPEYCRELEESLTEEQLACALSQARSLGWSGEAPAWVWAQIFTEALGPTQPLQSSPPWLESLDAYRNWRGPYTEFPY